MIFAYREAFSGTLPCAPFRCQAPREGASSAQRTRRCHEHLKRGLHEPGADLPGAGHPAGDAGVHHRQQPGAYNFGGVDAGRCAREVQDRDLVRRVLGQGYISRDPGKQPPDSRFGCDTTRLRIAAAGTCQRGKEVTGDTSLFSGCIAAIHRYHRPSDKRCLTGSQVRDCAGDFGHVAHAPERILVTNCLLGQTQEFYR